MDDELPNLRGAAQSVAHEGSQKPSASNSKNAVFRRGSLALARRGLNRPARSAKAVPTARYRNAPVSQQNAR
jgi:hypothetical protein